MIVLLINPSAIRPAIPPIGLEYVGEATRARGHVVHTYDFGVRDGASLEDEVQRIRPDVIGISVRNIDDANMFAQTELISPVTDLIGRLRRATPATIVVGGVGFSIMPREILLEVGADFGVIGEGEVTFPLLLDNLSSPELVPNLIYRPSAADPGVVQTCRAPQAIDSLPSFRRDLLDYPAYLQAGTVCNIRTASGCNRRCVFCPEPSALGGHVRFRPLDRIVDELHSLAARGVRDKLFVADSELNLSTAHAFEVAEAFRRHGGGIKWVCYMSPLNVSKELITRMKESGCELIIWGIESASDKMLESLQKDFVFDDVLAADGYCKAVGQPCAYTILFGGPGEDRATIAETYENLCRLQPIQMAVATGIRIYPRTKIHEIAVAEGEVTPEQSLVRPFFYRQRHVANELYPYIKTLFAGVKNCLLLGPSQSTPFLDKEFQAKLQQADSLDGAFRDYQA